MCELLLTEKALSKSELLYLELSLISSINPPSSLMRGGKKAVSQQHTFHNLDSRSE